MKTIGIDFGGGDIKLASMEDGHILRKTSIPAYSEQGLRPRLKDTRDAVYQMTGGSLEDFSIVGISMPGIVDPARKRPVGLIGKYEDSLDMDLEAWCRETFGLPMIMEMDSKLALLGELHYGCARGYQDAVMMILGTGVGTAVAYQGELLKSRNYTAGALASHIIVDMNDGPTCICNNRGCLESMASGWAMKRLVKEDPEYSRSGLAGEKELNFKVLQKWYRQQDPTAGRVVRHCVKAWRTGILNLIHAYNPEVVVLSGGIIKFQGLYEMLSEGIQSHVWDCCGTVDIKKAADPENSVLYGLHYLCQKQWVNEKTGN